MSFDPARESDVIFLRDFVVPYFSQVYQQLLKADKAPYVTKSVLKNYL